MTSKQKDTKRWAKKYKLTFPVLADLLWEAYRMYNEVGYIPLNLVIDKQMVIQYKDVGYQEGKIETKIEELLAK